jgi:hypothetical protein
MRRLPSDFWLPSFFANHRHQADGGQEATKGRLELVAGNATRMYTAINFNLIKMLG